MNTIPKRISDFLKGFPPFNMIPEDDLLSICKSIEVYHIEKESFIFKTNEPVKNQFYIVKDGAIGLFTESNQLVDECDEGDIFGLRALMRQDTYLLSARAIEESIVYSISSTLFDKYMTSNKNVNKYIMKTLVSNYRNYIINNPTTIIVLNI